MKFCLQGKAQKQMSGFTEKYNHYNWSRFWNCEVVGNKFDNPELIKEEEQ